MIVMFEQDLRRPLLWKPSWFTGFWDGKRTWRFAWIGWAVGFYPSPGIVEFVEHLPKTQYKKPPQCNVEHS